MAVLPGTIIPQAEHQETPEVRSANILTYQPVVIGDYWQPDGFINGTKGDTQPVNEPQDAKIGQYAIAHFDDFYYRIIFTPPYYELGNILFDSQVEVEVYNAYFDNRSLSTFDFDQSWGITPTEPVAAPYDFTALDSQTWTFDVALAGPASVATSAEWTIDGVDYAIPFTGNRVFLFTAPPNWAQSYQERLQWRTDVHRSFSGKEQRQSLLERPRSGLRYSYLMNNKHEIATLTNRLFGWELRSFGIPRWHDKSIITVATAVNDQTVYCDTTQRNFKAGGSAVLFVTPIAWEVLDIVAVNAGSLEVQLPIRNVWSAGTAIYPVYIGQLPSTMPWAKVTDSIWTGSVNFSADPVQTEPYLPVESPPLTYSGYELWLKRNNWRNEVQETSISNVFISDFGYGARQPESHSDFAEHVRRYNWLCKNRDEIDSMMAFLRRRNGRKNPVFIPSWDDDFTLVRDSASGEDTLEVVNNGYAYDIGYHPAKRTLIIFRIDGSYTVCTIASSALNVEGNVELYLTGQLGADVTLATTKMICYCDLRRQRSDSVVLDWKTDSVFEIAMDFVTVIQ